MKIRIWIWLIVAGIPLCIYPFVLLANIMSIAGEPPRVPAPWYLWFTSQGFLWTSTLYPLIYLYCVVKVIDFWKESNFDSAFRMSRIPLAYLGVVAGFFLGWLATGC